MLTRSNRLVTLRSLEDLSMDGEQMKKDKDRGFPSVVRLRNEIIFMESVIAQQIECSVGLDTLSGTPNYSKIETIKIARYIVSSLEKEWGLKK